MRNHNRLLGSVEGVDGFKTGYIRDSGFNLVSSVRRNNRHIVAVVLGGSSAGARDSRMRGLIEKHIVEAPVRRTAPVLAEAQNAGEAPAGMMLASAGEVAIKSLPASPPAAAKPAQAAANGGDPGATATIAPKPGSSDPIKPIAVKTVKVKLGPTQPAPLAPSLASLSIVPKEPQTLAQALAQAAPPPSHGPIVAPAAPSPSHVQPASPAAPGIVDPRPGAAPAPPAGGKTKIAAVSAPVEREAKSKPLVHTGWIIQVGAFGAEREAKQRLNMAQNKAKRLLARAEPFTEAVAKGEQTIYRARFAGLEKKDAEAVCKQLKRNDIGCMTIKK
jgi:D-alanyl-D-alanine carboxypeptidase